LHSNYYSSSTLNAIIWLDGEASSLDPHTLTFTQETKPVTLSIELRSIKHHGWQFIITLEESWFYRSIFLQTMSRSGFAEKNNRLKDRGIPSNTQNDGEHCMESTEISFTRRASKRQHI
jgi:hypothetical protein